MQICKMPIHDASQIQSQNCNDIICKEVSYSMPNGCFIILVSGVAVSSVCV